VVYRDGTVAYHGKRFVKRRGDVTATLTSDRLAELERLFALADYFALADDYSDYRISDRPWVITTYRRDSREKRVTHYKGDPRAPAALSHLEDEFDRIVQIELLIGTGPERAKHGDDW
jgi:hypothetical protein